MSPPYATTLAATIPKGPLPSGSTEALVVRVEPSDKLTSLASVTSATLNVHLPDGTEVAWSPSIQAQSATALEVVYVYGTNDVDLVGRYWVRVVLFVGATPYRCKRVAFDVLDESPTN